MICKRVSVNYVQGLRVTYSRSDSIGKASGASRAPLIRVKPRLNISAALLNRYAEWIACVRLEISSIRCNCVAKSRVSEVDRSWNSTADSSLLVNRERASEREWEREREITTRPATWFLFPRKHFDPGNNIAHSCKRGQHRGQRW